MSKSDYRCFLYKKENGKTVSKLFSATDNQDLDVIVDVAIAEGWHTTPADFADDMPDIDENTKIVAKDKCAIFAGDANILANADQVKDIDKLKQAYARLTGSEMDPRYKSIKGVRNAIKKALGEANVNQ